MNVIDLWRAHQMRHRPPRRHQCRGCHYWGTSEGFCWHGSHGVTTCALCCAWLGNHPEDDELDQLGGVA
jgi:hypothetical protein